LAEGIVADRDFPPFARATRDGYAVRAADVAKTPARLDVIGEIKAGDLPDNLTVDHGQAVSIMTGAALPPGADAVVMVEHTIVAERSHPSVGKDATSGWGNQCVEVQRSVSAAENFVPRGAEARAGELLLDRGGDWITQDCNCGFGGPESRAGLPQAARCDSLDWRRDCRD